MDRDLTIAQLVSYVLSRGLIGPWDVTWAENSILDALGLDGWNYQGELPQPPEDVSQVLGALLDDAAERGFLKRNTITWRDMLDTEIMGRLTPRPSQVIDKFRRLYDQGPEQATDWFYQFSQDTNYIRRSRIARDVRWLTDTEYGPLEITINLSKPEKDPEAIAAARETPASAYPKCQLCAENQGYAGRIDHPARQNHRIIPMKLRGEDWFLQYSPYVYYNEHCICLNSEHTPMRIDRACFEKLLDFVGQFPHYFAGSNADLPIVGGSILSHEHFQGGRHTFPMERAVIETEFAFPGFEDVKSGILRWPMSVIRLSCGDAERLAALADRILSAWRGYTDESAVIYAATGGVPHNTITPIARMRDGNYELDLVLRNNLTTPEHPLGLYHPHEELHHIKRENIGLIEVMGLAVLPSRLKEELAAVAKGLVSGADLSGDPLTAPHADWARDIARRYDITMENALEIVKRETGFVFLEVLKQAGVYKRDEKGRAAVLRFLKSV